MNKLFLIRLNDAKTEYGGKAPKTEMFYFPKTGPRGFKDEHPLTPHPFHFLARSKRIQREALILI
jgi:hypothetical protein